MKDFLTTPQAIAAIVAAITSLVTLLLTILTKNFIEKRLLTFKLDTEHKFEQRKNIKSVLASNKAHLLNACENLDNRLWNFNHPDHYKWLRVDGDYNNSEFYYFHSFIYRILSVYAWRQKIEAELIHLDTTIATKEDIEFVKFMKFYGKIFTDTDFFKEFSNDFRYQKDHIFKNNFDELYLCVKKGNEIISYNDYVESIPTLCQDKLLFFYKFLDGINPNEDRLRWQWFQILKMLNIAFLNSYGYDFQQTSEEKIKIAMETPIKSKLYGNFIFLLKEHKLDKQKEIKRLIKILETNR